MDFLKRFKGIGDKYARNIWMDMCDRDFCDTVAIDERIQHVSEVLGVRGLPYDEHEAVYQGIAREAGLEPWELDRILYWYTAEVLKVIGSPCPLTTA
jgi:alpha-glucosidase (family GH31 glycosyl hydrolase)